MSIIWTKPKNIVVELPWPFFTYCKNNGKKNDEKATKIQLHFSPRSVCNGIDSHSSKRWPIKKPTITQQCSLSPFFILNFSDTRGDFWHQIMWHFDSFKQRLTTSMSEVLETAKTRLDNWIIWPKLNSLRLRRIANG